MHYDFLRPGVSDGSSARAVSATVRDALSRLEAAKASLGRTAYEAGRAFSQALKTPNTAVGQAAFRLRTMAEVYKFRAAYLSLATGARQNALNAILDAQRELLAGHKERSEEFVRRASSRLEQAEAMEQAANESVRRVKDIPDPPALRALRASREVSVDGMVMSPKNGIPLLTLDFFPEDVRGALGRLGEVANPDGWQEMVKRLVGIGAGAGAGVATAAGQDATKDKPTAGLLLSALGGALAAVSGQLMSQYNRGQWAGQGMPSTGPEPFPWGVVAGVAAAAGVGFLVWRAVRS